MAAMEISAEVFHLDQIAAEFEADIVCISWQNEQKEWQHLTNEQNVVTGEQLKSSQLFKLLARKRDALHIIEDLNCHKVLSKDRLVAKHPEIRFYAEAALSLDDRLLGSLSIASRTAKDASQLQFPGEWAQEIACMLMLGGVDSSIAEEEGQVCQRPKCRFLTVSSLPTLGELGFGSPVPSTTLGSLGTLGDLNKMQLGDLEDEGMQLLEKDEDDEDGEFQKN